MSPSGGWLDGVCGLVGGWMKWGRGRLFTLAPGHLPASISRASDAHSVVQPAASAHRRCSCCVPRACLLPCSFKSKAKPGSKLESVAILAAGSGGQLEQAAAIARGTMLTRWVGEWWLRCLCATVLASVCVCCAFGRSTRFWSCGRDEVIMLACNSASLAVMMRNCVHCPCCPGLPHRYLVEAPPNVCTPAHLADAAAHIAAADPQHFSLEVGIWRGPEACSSPAGVLNHAVARLQQSYLTSHLPAALPCS